MCTVIHTINLCMIFLTCEVVLYGIKLLWYGTSSGLFIMFLYYD